MVRDLKSIPVGIPWCRKEDYPALRSILEDADQWPIAWDAFDRLMNKTKCSYEESGQSVGCININPATFPAWCRGKGYRINTDSCHKFAAEIAVKEQRNAGGSW